MLFSSSVLYCRVVNIALLVLLPIASRYFLIICASVGNSLYRTIEISIGYTCSHIFWQYLMPIFLLNSIFIARQHTDVRYWYSNSLRLSVCPSIRPSVCNIPVSDENGLTYIFTVRLPNHSSFISIKHLHEIPMGSPPAGALNTGGYKNFAIFNITRYILQTIQDTAIVTKER